VVCMEAINSASLDSIVRNVIISCLSVDRFSPAE
jgi:hypothetical protein